MPATTSSPCAFRRNSPYSSCSPVDGLRVKQTPVARVVAHVAEHHLHDVDRRAQVVGDVVLAAVGARARRVPRREHGVDRPRQLLAGILRELLAGLLAVDLAGTRPPARAGRRPTGRRRRPRRGPASSAPARPRTGGRRRPPPRRRTSARTGGRSRSANRSSPPASASPCTDSSFRPRFRIVSIMPGIETTAPDRTDTSSGSLRVAQPLAGALLERRQVRVRSRRPGRPGGRPSFAR